MGKHSRVLGVMLALFVLAIPALASTTATLTVGGNSASPASGTLTISFNGYSETISYGSYSTPAALASAIGGKFSNDYYAMGLCAYVPQAGGATVQFKLRNSAAFGKLYAVATTGDFAVTSFGFAAQTAVADHGTAALTVNGTTAATASYGYESTAESLAADLAMGIQSNSPVNLSAFDGMLFVESKTDGAATNYVYSLQIAKDTSSSFSQPSFQATPSSGNLAGGVETNSGNVTVYSFQIPSGGYDAAGNVVSYTDSSNGNWSFGYDTLNRLTAATGTRNSQTLRHCWQYDAFGNRTVDYVGSCSDNPAQTDFYTAQNRVQSGWVDYDAAGNTTYNTASGSDNQYLYDAEGRVCALISQDVTGVIARHGYVYNVEGVRVAKGTITSWSCDPSTNGFQTTEEYVLGPGGQVLTELVPNTLGTMAPQRTYIEAGGQQIGTYTSDSIGTHFRLTDWLGSLRTTTTSTGLLESRCASLPFGDSFFCDGDADSHHFTGKERDTESGNDYFEARYYGSSMGRFMSPDPSFESAYRGNPQTWNRYTYALNNPLVIIDPSGECWVPNNVGTFDWMKQGNIGQTCLDAVATSSSTNLRIYGSSSEKDITNYAANDHGMVDMGDVSQHHDAQFISQQTPGQVENYLAPAQGAALFNVAEAYHQTWQFDAKLVFTGGSTADGTPAKDSNGIPLHSSHYGGLNIDLKYMSDWGSPTRSAGADPMRTGFIIDAFARQNANLGAALTGTPSRFGLADISSDLKTIHMSHMHFQKNYPPSPRNGR